MNNYHMNIRIRLNPIHLKDLYRNYWDGKNSIFVESLKDKERNGAYVTSK